MENQVLALSGDRFKSIGFTDKRLFLSQKNERNFESLKKTGQDTSNVSAGTYVYLENLSSINLNTGSSEIKVKYLDYRKKNQSVSFEFSSKEKSMLFAQVLGKKFGLQKTVEEEKQWLPLLKKIGWLIFTIGFTYFLATMDNASELDGSGSAKSRAGAAILRMIYEFLGPVGITIIGTLISLGIAYAAYSRYKSPEQNVVFLR